MLGMMETLFNIGLGDPTVSGFLRQTGQPRLVWDAYRRLVATYGEVVAGLDAKVFDLETEAIAAGRDERELDFSEMRQLTRRHLVAFAGQAGRPFPQDTRQQLTKASARCWGLGNLPRPANTAGSTVCPTRWEPR